MRGILIVIILCLCSCETYLESNMKGLWVVEEMSYGSEGYMDKLYIKTMSFNRDHLSLPTSKGFNSPEKVKWEIFEYSDIDSLIIYSDNKIFNGRYKMTFAKDEEDNSIYCKLKSKETSITIHQVALNFFNR